MDLNQEGVIRPFMFETQHSSASGEEAIAVDKETQEKIKGETFARSQLGNCEWCSFGNCHEMPSENKNLCCQEMNLLGDWLDLESEVINSSKIKSLFLEWQFFSFYYRTAQCPRRIYFTLLLEWCELLLKLQGPSFSVLLSTDHLNLCVYQPMFSE